MLQQRPASFSGIIGLGRRDITPPVGIYHRCWGAAEHDVAEGVHRPLLATVLSIRDSTSVEPAVLIAFDGSWFRDGDHFIRDFVLSELSLPRERLLLCISHSHATCSLSLADADRPGGALIEPYLDRLRHSIVDAAREAMATAQDATLTVATGRCGLAQNRDLRDPDLGRFVCGYNPRGAADDTVLVGRLTADCDGRIFGTVVNYACHPTTLAWKNRLISPDYVGALREVVEAATGNAPCLFLQGASGDVGPAHQYSGDPGVADRNGRYLGHSALATIESMLPPRHGLRYAGVVESGAPLAVWDPEPYQPPRNLRVRELTVDLPRKELQTEAELLEQLQHARDRFQIERLHRRLSQIRALRPGPTTPTSVWLWQLGSVLLVAQPNEAYTDFQLALRAKFPQNALFVMNLVNGSGGYMSPAANYDHDDIYQVWQTEYARGALELLIERSASELEKLVSS